MESNTVYIQQIHWLDNENPEAEILFKIKDKQFWAFCHPCDFYKEEVTNVFFSFIEEEMPESAFWNENKERKKEIIASEKNRCEYYCYGKLKSISPIIVDCGAISFSFGDWINDETVIGNYVYFVISRLDIARAVY
jgi:hypothetical protein